MSCHFDTLVEIGEGALMDAGQGLWHGRFTSREFGLVLHEAMQYVSPYERYPRPVRRGAVAGQVLRKLRERGLVERVGPHPQRWWQIPVDVGSSR